MEQPVSRTLSVQDDRRRVGLALGGGAARGLAHVGVLEVLLGARVRPHCVAGASAGAVIGALLAAGLPPEQIAQLAREVSWRRLVSLARPGRRGLLSLGKLERMVVDVLGDLRFEDLRLSFACLAADLETAEPVVIREGRLAPAVCASAAVPGIFAPVQLGNRWLVDGGLLANVPVAAVRSLGAGYVVAVNVFGTKPRAPRNLLAIGLGAVETLIRRSGGEMSSADAIIEPAVDDFSYRSFRDREALIAAGRAAAEARLPGILAALQG